MKTRFYILILLFALCCCESKDTELTASRKAAGFTGNWTIEQVYANDHWGGPLTWRNTDWGKQIKFTADEYYEKTNGTFQLIGSYKIVSDTEIEITLDPPVQDFPTYTLGYTFEEDGTLTLRKNQFEGVVAERYRFNATE
ncbi:MAG TPA: hypothetical protein VIN08_17240 [Ohtaekwangia sp.]|uniref:hypothetical protein n=1 Tax=Ohtaekwangia sp. TaxID=2066019 RepID=UPI002F930712